MSKEEILKIQTCVLKVNIHCDGCKHKVRKILQKIEGVYTTKIDAEQGRVTVSGTVEAAVLIKKLGKSGKHAELWGAPKANNNNNNNTQLKNMQIDNNNNNNKKGGNKGGQKGGNNNQQPKGGQLNPQQLQQLSQMKGFQDLKLAPQFKDLKMPITNPNQKAVKFNLPEEDEDLSDEFDDEDYYDDDEDDDDDDDDEFEDEMDRHPPNKMKPMNMSIGQGGKAPNNISMMMNGMNGQKGENGGGQKIGGEIPVQVMGNGGKKGGNNNNNGGNQKQGGGGGNGGKNLQAMPVSNIMSGGGGNMGQMMNNLSRPQMGGNQNMAAAAVQGLPAGVEQQRQQYMAAMMNQQRAMGNERFQPMMYAPPPPAVNYMPPYPYPYPLPPPPPADPYTHYSSDEDTSICTVM